MNDAPLTLREFEQRLEDLRSRMAGAVEHVERLLQLELKARDDALVLARDALATQLANLNELRREVTDDRSRLMTKEGDLPRIDAAIDAVSTRLVAIERDHGGLGERVLQQKLTDQRVATLERSWYEFQATQTGAKVTWGKIGAVLFALVAVLGIMIAAANYLTN
jgi:chromosome segregation ATPase